ncbi:MAG TPA: GNAT family N-acetyltransferase [Actinomycetota bacterium]|nr:GNAT family N-acetyltransferase [Actinomycetota bacterium]
MEPLTTERLVLRPWRETDRGGFETLARDERVIRYIGDGSAWSAERIADVFGRQLRHWGEHGFGWYAVSTAVDDRWIGFAGLNHVGPEATEVEDHEVEIGWWLDPAAWGQGFATEAAVAARDDAFGRAALRRIIGRHRPENRASATIMRKLGMTFETDAVGRHGVIVRIHALSREEWVRLPR